jgi:hypothetical protein
MFKVELREDDAVVLSGRFDAAQVEKAQAVFDRIAGTCWVDFEKRLSEAGHELKLKNMNKHIREVFQYAGFDMIFEIT